MKSFKDIGVINIALTGTINAGNVTGQFTNQEYFFYKTAFLISMDASVKVVETVGSKLHRDNAADIVIEYLQTNNTYAVEGTGGGFKSIIRTHVDDTAFVKADIMRYVSANEPFRIGGDLYEEVAVGKQLTFSGYISLFYTIIR